MIKIKIIALGKIKEKYINEALAEYQKRLSGYCMLEITEIEPVRIPENPSKAQISAALEKEADIILSKIPANAAVVALCVEGKMLSSEELSEYINNTATYSSGCIVLIIGSSYGLSTRVKERSNLRLSLSRMTFPHKLMRVILFEQLYRSFKIIEGSTYHK